MLKNYKYTEKQQKELLLSLVVIVDTREKENSHVLEHFDKKKIKYIEKALSQGDYSFYVPKNEELSIPRDLYFDKEIVIERKATLEELAGNFAQQRDRFEKELGVFKGKMTLVIENSNYHDIYNGNYNTNYSNISYLGSLHSFSHRYNLPFIFMPDKKYTPVYIYETFKYYLRELLH